MKNNRSLRDGVNKLAHFIRNEVKKWKKCSKTGRLRKMEAMEVQIHFVMDRRMEGITTPPFVITFRWLSQNGELCVCDANETLPPVVFGRVQHMVA